MWYAIINTNLVENVVIADAPPARPNRTVVQLTDGQAVGPGDSYDGVTFTPYQPTAAELERRDAPGVLRQRLPQLRAWSNDAQDAAALTAMTAAQRIARQAVIETRVAVLSRLCMVLIWRSGEDDGG